MGNTNGTVKWSLLATEALALALVVVTVTVPTFVFATSDERAAPDEKADAQYDKGQADKACDKGGYDGYLGGACGYLN
jgi:hypothetical protein